MKDDRHRKITIHFRNEWNSYNAAKHRCTNPLFPKYERYGGRGIKMDPKWVESFAAFLAALGPKPSPYHVLARRNFDGDYTADNCFWGTRKYVTSSPKHLEARRRRAGKA